MQRGTTGLALKPTRRFKLLSDKELIFKEETIKHEDIERLTTVDAAYNPRDQSLYAKVDESNVPASIKRLAESLKVQQLYAVIAFRINGILYIIDGSRRRFGAILAGVDLKVLVTDDEATPEEIKLFAKEFNTNEDLSIREWGAIFQGDLELTPDVKQVELAEIYGKSTSYVTRALTAINVHFKLFNLFHESEPLAITDFNQLKGLEAALKVADVPLDDVVNFVTKKEQTSKEAILKALAKLVPASEATPKKTSNEETLVSITAKRYVKKKVSSNGNKVVFNCGRLTAEETQEIEAFIVKTVK